MKNITLSNIDNPDTWIPYKKSLCRTCYANCCTLLVEITAQDLIRLGYATELDIIYNLQKLIKTLKQLGIITRYNSRTEKFVLQQKANGDCLFLDSSRKCTVYSKRPLVCREHPIVASPRKRYCPYQKR